MNRYIYALGFFDGVHAGHRALLQAVTDIAGEAGRGVITFAAHPDTLVLNQTPKLINTPQDRVRLLKARGMERVITLPFDKKMQQTPWPDFLDDLIANYGAAGFVCGEDFRFGAGGLGNAALLEDYCRSRNLPCRVVPEQLIGGVRVSSTLIRQALQEGDFSRARQYLGHPHLLSGQVIHGKQLGRTLGVPTANLLLPPELVCPRFGVYACTVSIDGREYPAVTNIGTRPTVNGRGITVEPWILDYQGDLYDRTLSLWFHAFLRPEERFASLEALKTQIRLDAAQTRSLPEIASLCV